MAILWDHFVQPRRRPTLQADAAVEKRAGNLKCVIEMLLCWLRSFEEHDGRNDAKDDGHDPVARASCRHGILTSFWGLLSAPCLSRRHRVTYFDAAECYFKSTAPHRRES